LSIAVGDGPLEPRDLRSQRGVHSRSSSPSVGVVGDDRLASTSEGDVGGTTRLASGVDLVDVSRDPDTGENERCDLRCAGRDRPWVTPAEVEEPPDEIVDELDQELVGRRGSG
jgi:hypothetical protein